MRFHLLYVFFLVLICQPHLVHSQDYNSYSFNDLYNFESATIYDVFQDSEANYWIGTNEGIVKFNGVSFKRFTHENYSTSSSNIKEDSDGRIWFSNFRGQLFYIENDQLKVAIEGNKEGRLIQNYVIRYPNVIYHHDKVGEIYQTNILSRKLQTLFTSSEGEICASATSNDAFYFVELNNDLANKKKIHKIWELRNESDQCRLTFRDTLPLKSSKYQLLCNEGDLYYLVANDDFNLYKVGDKRFEEFFFTSKFSGSSLNNLSILENELLILTKNGYYSLDLSQRKLDSVVHAAQLVVSIIFKDREGNTWLGTLNDGLKIITTRTLTHAKVSESEIVHTCVDNNGIIYFSTVQGSLFKVEPPYEQSKLIAFKYLDFGFKLVFDPFNKRVYMSGSSTYYDTERQKLNPFPENEVGLRSVDFRDLIALNKDFAMLSTYNVVLIQRFVKTKDVQFPSFSYESLLNTSTKRLRSVNAYALAKEKKSNSIYVNYTDGLYHYSGLQLSTIRRNGRNLVAEIMIQAQNRGVWVATRQNEIIKIESGEIKESYQLHCKIHGIVESGKYLFVRSDDKIIRLNKRTGAIVLWDRTDGMLAEPIKGLFSIGSNLIVIGKNHVQKIPLDFSSFNGNPPLVKIDYLTLFDNIVEQNNFNFDHGENSITIHFSAISTRSQRTHKFQYRLNRGDWIETTIDAPFARFSNLASGHYVFEVRSINEDGLHSKIKKVTFSIDSHYTSKWWFIILIVITVGFVLVIVVRSRIKSIRKKTKIIAEQQQLKKEVYKSKIAAIRAQMNPHFMFNALNTIQEFILTNQKEVASEYLADFADLMRKYLSQSQHSEIAIAEEIETLEIYLGLENLRFDGELDFSVQCEPTLNLYEITIPVMTIQPFIENAIKHGLLHKSGPKKLVVSFQKEDEQRIQCIIEDNGIGRSASSKIRKNQLPNHNSFATNALDKKIELVNQNSNRAMKIQVEDVMDGEQCCGTKVILSFKI